MQTVTLRGEFDFRTAAATRRHLLAGLGNVDGLLVDLADVTRIDSAGLASLVEALQAARRRGRPFAITGVGAQARKMLVLARLDGVLTVLDEHGNGARILPAPSAIRDRAGDRYRSPGTW